MTNKLLYILLAFLFTLQANAQNKTSYTYDANNQLTQVVYSNGTVVKYTYDALGNRLSKKVTVAHELQRFTLSLIAEPAVGGSVEGAGTYEEGKSVTLRAMPNDGYEFKEWSDGNTSATRAISINANQTLTAYFTKKTVEPTDPVDTNPVFCDVNGDKVVDDEDVRSIRQAYVNRESVTNIKAYDVDGDGMLTVVDVAIVVDVVNGTYTKNK